MADPVRLAVSIPLPVAVERGGPESDIELKAAALALSAQASGAAARAFNELSRGRRGHREQVLAHDSSLVTKLVTVRTADPRAAPPAHLSSGPPGLV